MVHVDCPPCDRPLPLADEATALDCPECGGRLELRAAPAAPPVAAAA